MVGGKGEVNYIKDAEVKSGDGEGGVFSHMCVCVCVVVDARGRGSQQRCWPETGQLKTSLDFEGGM